MEAIILHKPGLPTANLQKGLGFENIETRSHVWEPGQEIHQYIFDANIILLICHSPDCNVIQIIPELRRRKFQFPIAVIDETENGDTQKRAALWGADAYYAKPFFVRNLAMELKNLVARKMTIGNYRWLRAFDIWLDLEQRMAKRERKTIALCNKEFALLEFFIINRGKVITRNSLLEHVWDRNADFSSNTLDVHINRLRKKIDEPFHEKLIHTIPCIGYIFDKKKKGK